jgi:hypothetical protein
MNRIRHTRGAQTLTVLALVGVTLTGCTSGPEESEAQALPTPVEVIAPDSREDCTTTLRTESSPTPNPNIITIDCGEKSAEVEGTFRDGYTNVYDPETAHDVEQIIVVGGEIRAWLRLGNSTCLILHTPGEAPTECKPIDIREAVPLEAPSPAPVPA